jgi:hypothetical protein
MSSKKSLHGNRILVILGHPHSSSLCFPDGTREVSLPLHGIGLIELDLHCVFPA